ncbi:MAG: hypothetical protein MJA29_10825, partial [Candidatus Omnitrophica bacterium]|nr:hypothetical protein [Candidatus Omnitrophota bacterium]
LQNVFQDVRDEAYQGYLTGVAFDENPYFKEGMTEDQDDPEFVLSEIWSEGWVSAHTDACTANLLLVARDMVATDDEEVLIGLYDDLTEAVEVLGEVLDFDSLHESWSELLG